MGKGKIASLFVGVLLVSFVFGIVGSLVSDRFILPRLYQTLYPTYGNNPNQNSAEAPRPIIQPVQVVEKESSVIKVAREVGPAVVSIVVTKELTTYYRTPDDLFFGDPFGDFFSPIPRRLPAPESRTQKREIGGGTGFIITSNGFVLTNKHVVDDEKAEYTIITKDGTEYRGEVVAKDPVNDLAIVRMKDRQNQKVANLPIVRLLPSVATIEVGQSVVAIGNALSEFDNTVTTGVISGKGRNITAGGGGMSEPESLRGLLQTDASINPGNSGGPLVNLNGEVIGINTAIASNAQGIGFAIPLDETIVSKILRQVEEKGRIVRPFLGVRYIMITPELNAQNKLGSDTGAWLRGQDDTPAVLRDTPAAKAGLRGGDIILKVDGKELSQKYTLQDSIAERSPQDVITLTLLRDGQTQEVKMTLEERPQDTAISSTNSGSSGAQSSSAAAS